MCVERRALFAWQPRASTVCFLAQLVAGIALVPLAQQVGYATLLTPFLPGPPPLLAVAWPVLAAGLALAATAFLPFMDAYIGWLLPVLGALAGTLATASIGTAIDGHIYVCPPLIWGALVGLSFGVASIFPRRQLREARRIVAAATGDIQIVNSCAWVVAVAGLLPAAARSTQALYVPVAIIVAATATGALAGLRWRLRRRWLRRVLRGSVPGLCLEAPAADVAPWLPVLDVLEADADEQVLLVNGPLRDDPYRSPDAGQACARLLPDFAP